VARLAVVLAGGPPPSAKVRDRVPADALIVAADSKDATDLELAMLVAADLADELLIIDGGTGRLDQSFGNLMLLASARFADVHLTAIVGDASITVVRSERDLVGSPGDAVSLFAVASPAEGVTTRGLRWPLEDSVLVPGSTLGVSNVMLGEQATVTVEAGVVLAVQP
jgi:thiamine pyrophosphokinase